MTNRPEADHASESMKVYNIYRTQSRTAAAIFCEIASRIRDAAAVRLNDPARNEALSGEPATGTFTVCPGAQKQSAHPSYNLGHIWRLVEACQRCWRAACGSLMWNLAFRAPLLRGAFGLLSCNLGEKQGDGCIGPLRSRSTFSSQFPDIVSSSMNTFTRLLTRINLSSFRTFV
jgi:hypothetical protein